MSEEQPTGINAEILKKKAELHHETFAENEETMKFFQKTRKAKDDGCNRFQNR